MINRRPFCFRPLASHAEGHLEVTTIVVVVIDIYLYDYYYVTGYSELPYGPCRPGRRRPEQEGPALPICPFPVPRAGLWSALSRFRRRSFLFLAPLSCSSQSALWRDPACRPAQSGARSGGAWGSAMGLQTAEDDHHRLEVRDAATAAQVQRAEPAGPERAAVGF